MNNKIAFIGIVLNLFVLNSEHAFGIGTSNTPGRPNPPLAPGAFQEPFNPIPSTEGRAKIEVATPSELATPQSLKNRKIKPITVVLIPAKGETAAGTIQFFQDIDHITMKGHLSGLKPGKHGIHIHEKGNCKDTAEGFVDAGPHFNPQDVHHGSLKKGHVGDLGNIVVDKHGNSDFTIHTNKFTLIQGSVHSIMGRTIMIHQDPDDEKTDPAGKSGKRILCGVIT